MNNRYYGAEKRQQQRVAVNFIVMYRVSFPLSLRMMVGDKEVCAIAQDLSEGGMAVLTNYEIPLASQVQVKFIVLNELAPDIRQRTRSLQVNGEVRYCFMTRERVFRLGVHFLDLSNADRTFISDFVRNGVSSE